jgi:glycogen phosphorylase
MKIHSFTVKPKLPESLKPLEELSNNMWFTWNWDAIKLFVSIDINLWHRSHRNPKWVLANLPTERIQELSQDKDFIRRLNEVYQNFKGHIERDSWFVKNSDKQDKNFKGAYFSMEFGIGEGLPMYSGGLGILAGDHLKSASDLGLPIVGVGLLYQKGYIQQVLNRDGWQVEKFPENDWANMPVHRVRDDKGNPVTVDVPIANDTIKVAVWRVPVGRTSLYLLDTTLPENPPHYRKITEQLYGGDRSTRIEQEIVLGIGGVRALEAMKLDVNVYHINEGHSAFLLLERIRGLMKTQTISFEQAKEIVWASSIFTTHTPVIAGNEYFDLQLVTKYLEPYSNELGISLGELLETGKDRSDANSFCMTILAMKYSAYINGVSKLHRTVSKSMWQDVWPNIPKKEIPIKSITNGVHTASWVSHEHNDLYKKHIYKPNGKSDWDPSDISNWNKVDSIPNDEFWQTHKARKEKLFALIRKRFKRQLDRLGYDQTVLDDVDNMLDPNAFTIGFARRFASYKRAHLIFKNLDRLSEIMNNPNMPVQIIIAGKAHPVDNDGKELVKHIFRLMYDNRFKHRLVFLEDYNMNVARYLTQGVDLWLNTPIRLMEASGTSGMKASVNGVLNLSILDGWWDEAYHSDIGWAIGGAEHYNDDGERDYVESEAIYNLLQKEIVPLYYEMENGVPAKWIEKSKKTIKTVSPYFSTHRMLREYYDMMYVPAHRNFTDLKKDDTFKKVATWRKKVAENWNSVKILNTYSKTDDEIVFGNSISVNADVSLGKLSPKDVSVQIYLGKTDAKGDISDGNIIEMKHEGKQNDHHHYTGEIKTSVSGKRDFAIRILPANEHIAHPFTPPLIKWEE